MLAINLERIIPDEYITDQKPDQPFELPAGATILDQQQGGSEGEPVLWRYIRYMSSTTSLGEENWHTSSAGRQAHVQNNSCFREHHRGRQNRQK